MFCFGSLCKIISNVQNKNIDFNFLPLLNSLSESLLASIVMMSLAAKKPTKKAKGIQISHVILFGFGSARPITMSVDIITEHAEIKHTNYIFQSGL